MAKRKRKKRKQSDKRGSDRPIVVVKTDVSLDVDFNLMTVYPCSFQNGKWRADREHPLDNEAKTKLILEFLEALHPIEAALLRNNLDKEAIAGRQGNEIARKTFDIDPLPDSWQRGSKMSYVLIYQANATLSSWQEREKIASVFDELGWDASYTQIARKMEDWYSDRSEKKKSKKQKAAQAAKAKKKKADSEDNDKKSYKLNRILCTNIKNSGTHPEPPEQNSPYFDYGRGANELCSHATPSEDDKNIIIYDTVPIGESMFTIELDLRELLPKYSRVKHISRPRFNCRDCTPKFMTFYNIFSLSPSK